MKDTFALEGEPFIKLCDLLKTMGYCENGGQAKSEIAAGEVLVNGTVETRKRFKVITGSIITYQDHELLVES